MSTLTPDRWREVSPYLDQALTLPEQERAKWLAALFERNPTLAADLQTLLHEHETLARREFLEQAPVALPGEIVREGQVIGPYTLVAAIGDGGMGTIWLARRSDGRFERNVAIKFPHLALIGHEGQERFKREGSVLGRLTHPHIATLLDAGLTPGGQPYLVLEHVDGHPIDQYCDRLGLDVRARVRLFLDVLAAVAHAHTHLIVHRDLKPSNVFVTTDSQVKLLDFGIAKLMEEGADPGAATRGAGPMTPAYAAPEQLTGAPVTTATDVYALGVLLYVLLSGQHPTGAGTHSPADLVRAIVDTESRRLSEAVTPAKTEAEKVGAMAAARGATPEKLRRLLRGDLDTIVGKSLKKNPTERYASVTAMADDLRHYLRHEPIGARPDTLAYRAAKFARRNKVAMGAVAAVFLALVLGAGASTWGLVRAKRAERLAAAEAEQARRQTAIAEAVNKFLNDDLLASVAPSAQRGRGRDVLMREVLDVATKRIEAATKPGGSIGEDPFVESSIRMTLGRTYRDLGEYEVAEAQFRRAIELRRRIPEARMEYGASLGEMGKLTALQGRFAAAESLYGLALQVYERSEAPVDTVGRIFPLLTNLAALYERQGRYSQAESLYVPMLGPVRRLAGEEGAITLSVMLNLSNIYQATGRYVDAESLRTRMLAIHRRVDGEEAPSTLRVMNNLANTYLNQGYFDKANDLLVRTLESKRRVFGPEHQSTIITVNTLALLFDTRGKHSEAERRHRETLAVCERVFGPEHPLTLEVRTCVAFSISMQGRYAEAHSVATKAVASGRTTLPENDETTLAAMLIVGMCQEGQGRLVESESTLRRVVDGIQARNVTNPVLRLRSEAHLGIVLGKLGRRDAAGAILQRSLVQLPVWRAETRAILRDAITLYDAWQATDPTGDYGKRAEELRSRII